MRRMTIRWAAIFIAAFSVSGNLSYSSSLTQVSPGNTVKCQWGKTAKFADILQDLASQAHLTFVVEGKPLQAELGTTLHKTFPQGTGSIDTVVKAISMLFDYNAERKGNVFYLTKRYTSPADLPSVTFEECLQASSDVIRSADRLNPKIPNPYMENGIWANPRIDPLIHSLSGEQIKAVESGLPVSSLTTASQSALQKMGFSFYVQGPLSELDKTMESLENLKQPDAKLILKTANGKDPIVYNYRFGKTEYFNEMPLTPTHKFITGEPERDNPQAATNLSDDTIGSQIKRLNESAPAGEVRYAVDDFLAEKSILVIGKEYSPPMEIATAIARIYGLRLMAEPNTQSKEKELRVTRPRAALIADVKELPASMARLLPAPLVHIVHREPSPIPVTPTLGHNARPPLPLFMVRMEFAKKVRNAAIQRLEQIMLPLLQSKPDKQVSLVETSAEVKNLLAIILMMDSWNSLWKLTNPEQPRYITNPGEVYLQGGENRDKATGERSGFRAYICYKDAKGQLCIEIAVIRNYPKIPPK
jgi:hypothetical protein